MGRTASIDIKRPRTDDRRVWDVVFGVFCSLDQLEQAVQADTAQAYKGGQEMFKSHAEQADLARFFTHTMRPAPVWDLRWHGPRLLIFPVARSCSMLHEAGFGENPGEANVRLLGHRNGSEALNCWDA